MCRDRFPNVYINLAMFKSFFKGFVMVRVDKIEKIKMTFSEHFLKQVGIPETALRV